MKGKLVHQHRYSTRLQSRLMASNRNLKNKGRRSQEELVAEVLNPEQLDRSLSLPPPILFCNRGLCEIVLY